MVFRIVLTFILLIAPLGVTASPQESTVSQSVTETEIGIQLYKQGNYQSAIRALEDSVSKNKTDADAWYYLGLTLNRTGAIKEARKAFEKTIALRPAFTDAHLGLAYSLFRLNKLKEAVSTVKPFVNTTSAGEVAHYILGAVALRQGSPSAAVQEADAALTVKPNYPPALLLKSQALFALYVDRITSSGEKPKRDANGKGELVTDAYSYARAAIEPLAKYVEIQKDDKDIAVWRDQLEALRAFAQELSSEDEAASVKEVTTKAKVIRKPEPQYTANARSSGVTGTVVLRAIFGSDGNVRNIRIVKGLPDGLTEAALSAARRIKFLPGTKDGRPVSMYIQLEYNFNLN
jgi:TonB family protein